MDNLQSNKKCYSFNAIVATIDVIAHEQIVCVGQVSTDAEQLDQIVKLAVDVAANCDWAAHGLHVGLAYKNLSCLSKVRPGNEK